jgi:two-component system nitrogen regulation response regulator NtrX
MAMLMAQGWPGNVRELRNLCERLAIMTPTANVGEDEVAAMLHGGGGGGLPLDRDLSLREAREMFERRMILAKLRELGGNVRATADALEIERSNLYRKLKAYGIDPSEIVASD